MENGYIDLGDAGTHMHVVDTIATYRPSVVAEVVLNSWVPHLKFGRKERVSSLSIRTGGMHEDPRHQIL